MKTKRYVGTKPVLAIAVLLLASWLGVSGCKKTEKQPAKPAGGESASAPSGRSSPGSGGPPSAASVGQAKGDPLALLHETTGVHVAIMPSGASDIIVGKTLVVPDWLGNQRLKVFGADKGLKWAGATFSLEEKVRLTPSEQTPLDRQITITGQVSDDCKTLKSIAVQVTERREGAQNTAAFKWLIEGLPANVLSDGVVVHFSAEPYRQASAEYRASTTGGKLGTYIKEFLHSYNMDEGWKLMKEGDPAEPQNENYDKDPISISVDFSTAAP